MRKTEALTQALVLAITAPDDERAAQAVDLAEKIAATLTIDQVDQCKAKALGIIEGIEGGDYDL